MQSANIRSSCASCTENSHDWKLYPAAFRDKMKNSIAKPYDYKGDFPIMMNLSQARRIVVKVGTSTLTYPTGKLNIRGIERLVRCIADLHNRGY